MIDQKNNNHNQAGRWILNLMGLFVVCITFLTGIYIWRITEQPNVKLKQENEQLKHELEMVKGILQECIETGESDSRVLNTFERFLEKQRAGGHDFAKQIQRIRRIADKIKSK